MVRSQGWLTPRASTSSTGFSRRIADGRCGRTRTRSARSAPCVKGGLFDWREFGGRDAHDCDRSPLSGLNNQPKTLTALAITSASVVNETIACTVIIAFARRVIGMVSVGEKAT